MEGMYELEMLVNKMNCLHVEMLAEPNSRGSVFSIVGKYPSLLFL